MNTSTYYTTSINGTNVTFQLRKNNVAVAWFYDGTKDVQFMAVTDTRQKHAYSRLHRRIVAHLKKVGSN